MKFSVSFMKPLPGLLPILLAGMVLTSGIYWMLPMNIAQSQQLDDRPPKDQAPPARLEEHVRFLAARIGERNIWHPAQLEEAAAYIKNTWARQGYAVQEQEYTVEGLAVQNLWIELAGNRHPEKIIIIGAHYDSVLGSPGANDNGSGVAALLELSRRFKLSPPGTTVRFVAFVNEEPPFFLSRRMGSRVYAARARQDKEKIIAMLSLETIGYYSDTPGSQNYPFPLSFFYPDKANFLAFVSNLRSRALLNQAADTFSRYSSFPAQRVAAPFWMTGIGWSDHWSFWREGYRAIMVTDTAFFRYRHYHTATDTPDKLVYGKMAMAVDGLYRMIAEMAGVNSR